jgi:hypothetical protein
MNDEIPQQGLSDLEVGERTSEFLASALSGEIGHEKQSWQSVCALPLPADATIGTPEATHS